MAALGVELENLRSEELKLDFLQCYFRMLSQPPLSALISFIHVNVPIRKFIPLEANWGFVRASGGVRTMLDRCIEERIREVKSTDREKAGGPESRDLLTYMIEEREAHNDELTIADIRGHVSLLLITLLEKKSADTVNSCRTSFPPVSHPSLRAPITWA